MLPYAVRTHGEPSERVPNQLNESRRHLQTLEGQNQVVMTDRVISLLYIIEKVEDILTILMRVLPCIENGVNTLL